MDLKRTRAEAASREAVPAEEDKLFAAEGKAERQQFTLAHSLKPRRPCGRGRRCKTRGQVAARLVNICRRRILRRPSPNPIGTGKNTVGVEGERSRSVVTGPRQESYFRLTFPVTYAILRVRNEPKGKSRVIQTSQIMPVSGNI